MIPPNGLGPPLLENPRRPSLAGMIRAHTNNGEEMMAFALRIMRGELVATYVQKGPDGRIDFIDGPPQLVERIRALEWLTEKSHIPLRARTSPTDEKVRAEMAQVFAKLRAKLDPEVYGFLIASIAEANADEPSTETERG